MDSTDNTGKKVGKASTRKPLSTHGLVPIPGQNPSTHQEELNLTVHKEIEIDGIGMGVLNDGTPFLTGRGLARLCGVHSPRISEIQMDWNSGSQRVASIRRILDERGVPIPEQPYLEVNRADNVAFYAYSDVICLAVLEYYAFDAGAQPLQGVQRSVRPSARQGAPRSIMVLRGANR